MSVVHPILTLCPRCKQEFIVFDREEHMDDGTTCYIYKCPKCGYEEKTCIKYAFIVG